VRSAVKPARAQVKTGRAVLDSSQALRQRRAGITGQHEITVSARFVGRSQTAEEMVLSLVGRKASKPLRNFRP
jgi:hypothetical protein